MNRHVYGVALGLTLLTLAGCSTAVFHHNDPSRHIVVLDREPVSVVQSGNNQWEAWGAGSARTSSGSTGRLDRQIKAIQIVSGCSVTQSSVDPDDARKLTATVSCPDALSDGPARARP